MPVLIFLILMAATKVVAQPKTDSSDKTIKFVYSKNIFQDANTNDAEAVSSVLTEYIASSYNLPKPKEKHVVNIESELGQLIDADTDLFIILGTEYLKLRDKNVLVPRYSLEVNDKIGFEYLLLVNKKSAVRNISGLRGSRIGIMATQKISPTYLWLDKQIKINTHDVPETFFGSIKLLTKANALLLSVFFNELDACVVSRESYQLVSELNPQLKQELVVIDRSPQLLTGLICYNRNIIGTEDEKIADSILNTLHENEYGRQLLNLFSVDKLVPFREEHLQSLIDLMKNE